MRLPANPATSGIRSGCRIIASVKRNVQSRSQRSDKDADALDRSQPVASTSYPRASDWRTTRRTVLLSVFPATLVSADLLSSLETELGLWRQEVDLYSRQLGASVQDGVRQYKETLGLDTEENREQRSGDAPASRTVDAKLAGALLQAPIQAISELKDAGAIAWDQQRYERDYDALYRRELPYFERAGLCGHCGAAEGDAGDVAWFGFRDSTAVSGMELMHSSMPAMYATEPAAPPVGMQASSADTASEASAATTSSSGGVVPPQERVSDIGLVRARMGEIILDRIATELQGDELQNLLTSTSSDLDWIRQGVRVLLAYFEATGFTTFSGIAFFGASRSEPRNHVVWAEGEPAYAKVWLRSPAGQSAGRALRAEEGFAPDYFSATVGALLARCRVDAKRFRKYPSFLDDELEADQFTVLPRRDGSSPPSSLSPKQRALLDRLPPFKIDACPTGDETTSCY